MAKKTFKKLNITGKDGNTYELDSVTSEQLNEKASINDESQSQTSVYSSQKVTELIAAKDGYVTEFEEDTGILTIKQG